MTMTTTKYLMTMQGITICMDGVLYTTVTENINYKLIQNKLLELTKEEEVGFSYKCENLKNEIISLIAPIQKIIKAISQLGANIIIENGLLKYTFMDKQGEENTLYIKSTLVDRIIAIHEIAGNIQPFVNFAENLVQNPLSSSVNELYLFLEHNSVPITDDGCFLAYKKVKSDFTDIRTGTFDNTPGNVVSMDRKDVDNDKTITCSSGLHVCSKEYLSQFSSDGNDTVIVVKINPKNVVSVPNDYNNAKMRVCEYTVIEELKEYKTRRLANFYSNEESITEEDIPTVEEKRYCQECGCELDDSCKIICNLCRESVGIIKKEYNLIEELEGNFSEVEYVHAGSKYIGYKIVNIPSNKSIKSMHLAEKIANSKFNFILLTFKIKNKIKYDITDYDRVLILTVKRNGNTLEKPRFMCPHTNRVELI